MAVHAHAQGLDALHKQERIEGAEAGADVAQAFDAGADDEGDGSEDFAEIHAVIGAGGLVDLREGALFPIELAAVDDHAADGVAVSAHEFGERVHHDVGAVIDGAAQIGRGEGVVDHQGDVVFVGDLGDGFDIEHAAAGIGDRLAVEAAWFWV